MDKIPPARRSANMRAIKSKNMVPEMEVRSLVHRMGYRYRLHAKELPGKPDLVFPRLRKIIFVHGCFWHKHKASTCRIARIPKSNVAYWLPKLERNRLRDNKACSVLRRHGWEVLIVWECQINRHQGLANRVERFLKSSTRRARNGKIGRGAGVAQR
ncbi:MAG TPA: DNA mismatch endonuclease Vsr [bacterium]|nr:DNA mismatch endonuclease Vsr [bacterium]